MTLMAIEIMGSEGRSERVKSGGKGDKEMQRLSTDNSFGVKEEVRERQ